MTDEARVLIGVGGSLYRVSIEHRDWGASRLCFERRGDGWTARVPVPPDTRVERLSIADLRDLLEEATRRAGD